MGTPGSPTRHSLDDTLGVFAAADGDGAPLTTSEVADALGCARRTAYGKLEELADRGDLQTKKVGARGRVWWRATADEGADGDDTDETGTALERVQFNELVGTVTEYAIFVLDPDGRVRTWNEGAHQLKGYERAEILGEHVSTFYTEEAREADAPERNLAAAAEDGRAEDEGWRVREDDTTFWADVTITALRDDDGGLRGFVKITRDMTERHEYEERLRTEKERFEALVREVRDYAIFMLDADGHVQTWNEGAHQLKGYERAEILGEHVSTFYTEEAREAGAPERNLAAAAEDGRTEDEGERVHEDGSTFWANVTITALYDEEGTVRGYAKVTRDMTERHEYEERLRRQRDELDELNQINTVIREIDQALVSATSRQEIEQAVCDRLAASDIYSGAWTAEYAPDYADITPRAWAGVSDDYIEATRTGDADSDRDRETERGVGARALETRTIQLVDSLQRDETGEPWRDASVEAEHGSAIAIPLLYNQVEYGVLTVYADTESAFDSREIDVMSELGETISHAIAAMARKEREQTLTALQTSTRELLHAASRTEIGDVIVDTLTDALALADAVVYCFDTTGNALEPVSSSYEDEAYADELAPLSAGEDSPVWTSFMEGETLLTDSVVPARGIGSRRTLVAPLGNHGVLAVAAADRETFDRDRRNLVELVAATAEAAFDRVESQANLRERDELLQEQNQRLQRLNQINTIIREIDQGLVQATTRDEIHRVVCDRLTESDRFRFAWIGTPDDLDSGLSPAAWSGDGRGYLDSVDLGPVSDTAASEPATTAAATGDVTVVSNVADDLRNGQWRKAAFSREFQSVISLPLTHGDVTHGILTVYADRPQVFDQIGESVFAELGETIANAINAVDTKRALLSDHAIELEFRLGNESTSFLARIARQLDCEIAFEGMIPVSDERVRVFFLARDVSRDAVGDLLDRSVTVESNQVIATGDDGHLVEAVISGPTLALSLVEHGASLRTLTVTPDGARLTVDLPSGSDVRGFVSQFQTQHESAEFVARRQRERPVQTPEGLYAELEDVLTDRQLEVLETSYYGGYFTSPRAATGGDIADLLDVSQPTVTEQLRAAQAKVLDLVLAERSGPSRRE